MRAGYTNLLLRGATFLLLVACAGGPGGNPGPGGVGDASTDGGVGPLGSAPNSVNPGTRPTPGFTEVEMSPATSTSLPAPGPFLKSLQLNLTPLIEITEVRMFVRDLNLDEAVSAGLEYPGNFLFRLLDGNVIVDESLPELGVAGVPEGTYSKLDLSFEVMEADEIPPGAEDDPLVNGPLIDHSIVVEGHLGLLSPIDLGALGSLTVVQFRFVSDQTAHLEVNSPQGFDFGPDLNHLFLAFKIRTWLDLSIRGLVETVVATLDLPTLLNLLNGGLLLIDSSSGNLTVAAVQLETNINASLRTAPSDDGLFQEADVQEDSFSVCLANCP
ncbi:MAG TPA: hypothetical protein VJR29_06605 [bacterium]|nr:hypothetical protein [bacterium]